MSEEKNKVTPLPNPCRPATELREQLAALRLQQQERLQNLANNDPVWRDAQGRIEALVWVLPEVLPETPAA